MERWQENKVQSSIACTVIRRNKMIEWTCCQCGNKYTDQTGDTDERMCDECLNHEDASDFLTQRDDCLNHEDKTTDYGPPYSMANTSGEPVGSQPYPKWNDKAKEYDYPLKRRIEVEITYEGEEE
jgi:hypothetical protein